MSLCEEEGEEEEEREGDERKEGEGVGGDRLREGEHHDNHH